MVQSLPQVASMLLLKKKKIGFSSVLFHVRIRIPISPQKKPSMSKRKYIIRLMQAYLKAL